MARLGCAVVVVSALASCSQPPADEVTPGVTLCFVVGGACAPSNATLPLDAADNFAFQVEVFATINSLLGEVSANLTLWGAAGVSSTSPVTTTAVTLQPSGANSFSAIVTMSALQPGPLTVQAEVAGTVVFEMAQITAPVVAGVAAPTGTWSGNSPRVAICVETSATKGTVSLTADDPAVLTATTPSPVTLVTGPCMTPPINGGPGISHAEFVSTFMPPFSVEAQLAGRPTTAAPGPWEAAIAVPGTAVAGVELVFSEPIVDPVMVVPNATVYDVAVNATQTGTTVAIQNLPITFSAGGATGAAVVPTSATTGPTGSAPTVVVVPFDTQVTLLATGGSAAALLSLASLAPAPTIALSAQPSTTAFVPNGVVYDVAATAATSGDAGNALQGLAIAFAATAGIVAPATDTTGSNGVATTQVTIPTGTVAVVSAVGDGVEAILPLGSPDAAVTIQLTAPIVGALQGGGTLYNLVAYVQSTAATANISGATVTFGSTAMGIAVTPPNMLTDANGLATTGFVLPKNTSAVMTATVDGVLAALYVSDISTPPVVTGVLWTFSQAMADSQGALETVGVQILDGISGVGLVPVSFTASLASDEGLVAEAPMPASTTTDSGGNASTEVYVPSGQDLVVSVNVAGTTWTSLFGP